jgi:ribosomal subunit interface protein
MQLSVSGKRLDVGDSLRNHVGKILQAAVDRYFGRALEGKVVFERQRHIFRADISVHVRRGMTLQSHHEASDPYAAFDGAVERLDHRLKRHKGRIKDRKRGKGADADDGVFEAARYAVIETEAETLDEAQLAAPIVAEMTTDIGTLSVGEAVARLEGDRQRVGARYMAYRRPVRGLRRLRPDLLAGGRARRDGVAVANEISPGDPTGAQ